MKDDKETGGTTGTPVEVNAVVMPLNLKPNYNISFHNDGETVGTLDFNGPNLVFTGRAEESAKIFIEWAEKSFAGRLADERDRCAKLVDHIRKEGGGTYGDFIRKSA